MPGYRGRARLGLAGAAALVLGLLWGTGGATVTAQSTSPGAAASGACAGLVEMLPPQLNGTAVQAQAFLGSDERLSGVMPVVAPLLETLGLTADDLCVVTFLYGTADDLVPYMMWRFSGADPKALLEPGIQTLTPLVCDPSYLTCTPSETTVAGRPVTRIEATAVAQHFVTDLYGFGDTIVLGTEGATFEAIVSALPAPAAPLPEVTPPPEVTPTPTPSPSPNA